MNTIEQVDITYLRPSRTIEKICLNGMKSIFIYNYEGKFFRVFSSDKELNSFFDNDIEPEYNFDNETDLDYFLKNY